MRCRYWIVLFAIILSTAAHAQNTRSAVSINGSDLATCTVPDPCRTFGVAISRTNAGGEILALTSGGYGPFTIDRDVTVQTAPGVYAGINAATGDGIVVNAGATASVVIRGLTINGLGTGEAGISVGSAQETHIEHCVIDRFANYGILASQNTRISDTTVRNTGFRAISIGGAVQVTINRVAVKNTGGIGINVEGGVVTVRDTVVAVAEHGYLAGNSVLNLENCLASEASNAGIVASSFSIVRVSNTVSTGNDKGLWNVDGTMISWGNNKVRGNTGDFFGPITVVAQD